MRGWRARFCCVVLGFALIGFALVRSGSAQSPRSSGSDSPDPVAPIRVSQSPAIQSLSIPPLVAQSPVIPDRAAAGSVVSPRDQPPRVSATSLQRALEELERIDVPADSPGLWPKFTDGLIAVSRADFERRWSALRPRQQSLPEAVIESLDLTATLVGSSLTAGTGTLRISSRKQEATWLAVRDMNLAISALTRVGSAEPLIWGAADDGQLWVYADPPQAEWTCAWSLGGQMVAGTVTFDVRLPMALTSTMKLRLPAGRLLRSPTLSVRQASSEEAGWTEWEVFVGSETSFRLIVEEQQPKSSTPLVLYRRQLTAGIREDHLRFEVMFQPEVLGGELDELQFSIPNNTELDSITWGSDVPLAWSRSGSDGVRQLIRARLPDRQQGVMRQVRLEGIVLQRPGAVVTLPQIELVGGVFRSGGIQVSIIRPLQIASLRTLGCRQESPLLATAEGETFQFQQTVPASQVTLEVRRPRSTLNADVLTRLACRHDEWTASAEIQWASTTGTAFQLAVRVPQGWEVNTVRAMSATGREERISWESVDDTPGWSRIAIELLEALTPERNRRIRIDARRRAPEPAAVQECPLFVPIDCQTVHRLYEVSGGEQFEVYAAPQSRDSLVAAEAIPARWRQFLTWPKPPAAALERPSEPPPASQLWLATTDPALPPLISVYPRSQPVTADVRIDAEAIDALLTESIELRVRPSRGVPLTRLLVYLSEPGDDIAWNIVEPSGWQLTGTRIPREHQPLREAPVAGELWELRLPAMTAEQLVIRGQRAKPLSLPMSVGLVHLPQSTLTTALVSLETLEQTPVKATVRGLEDLTTAEIGRAVSRTRLHRRREWSYSGLQAELLLVSHRTSLRESPCPASLELRSLVSAHEDDFDYHRAIVRIPAYSRTLKFSLADTVELLHIELDGQSLPVDDENSIAVPPQAGSAMRVLTVVYRSTARRGFLRDVRPVPQPVSADVVWTNFRWEYAVPPVARITSEPAGIRFDQSPGPVSWSERLFGPLSRQAGATEADPAPAPMFLPWEADAWKNLLPRRVMSPLSVPSADGGLAAPPEWHRHAGSAPEPVGSFNLVTWNAERLRLLSWLVFLVTTTLLLSLRASGIAPGARLSAMWLAAWCGIAVATDPPFVELVGGVIAATLLATLVPARWLEWHWPRRHVEPEVPTGSTQSFTIPKSAITGISVLAVIFLIQQGLSHALPPEPDPDHVVVVPVDERGQPGALVYLTQANWDRLVAASSAPEATTPRLLLQTADYQASLAAGQRVSVSARFEVLVPGTETQIHWPLRVSSFGPAATQSCTVDGQPATVISLPEGAGFQISWTRPPPPVSATGAALVSRHVITLDWQHAWRREAGLAVFELLMPFAGASHLDLMQLPPAELPDAAAEAARHPGFIADSTIHRIAGLTDRCRVCWRESGPAAEPVEVQVDTLEAWSFQASLIDIRSRTILQPRTGAARQLRAVLPANAVIRRWTASVPAEFRPAGRNEPAGGLIEFAEPLTAPVTIDLEYVTPLSGPPAEFRWSGLRWNPVDATSLSPGQRLWAISAPDELKLQPQSLDDSGLAPVSLDSARPLFGELLADRLPNMVYQVSGTNPVAFSTSQGGVPRDVLLWEQTGTIVGDRLKWEIQGEIAVSGLPLYTHVFSVDRRLNIESITVLEGGVSRRVRWSESRSSGSPGTTRLTVFLFDPATDTQRIQITASIPMNPAAVIPLPNVRCEDARISGGRLIMKSPRKVELEWLGNRGLQEVTQAEVPQGGTADALQTRIFDQIDPDWRATIRVLTAVESQTAQAVHMVHSDDAQSLLATSLWRVPKSRLSDSVAIVVPSPWELGAESHVVNGEMEVVRGLDGVWNLIISADGADDEVLVNLRLKVQRSALRAGMLPLPRPVGDLAEGFSVWVAELIRLPQSALLSSNLSAIDESLPRDWESGRWQEPALAENDRLHWWHVPPDVVMVPLAPVSAQPEAANIEWLEHLIWCEKRDRCVGMTYLRFADPVATLVTRLPETVEFKAALIGRQAGITRSGEAGEIQIASRDGEPFSEAWLIWNDHLTESYAPLTVDLYHWPEFPNASIRQLAVTVFPASGSLIRGTGAWVAGDWADRSLLRLESLSDQLQLAAGAAAPELEHELLQQYQLTARQLGENPAVLGSSASERRGRWKRIVDRIDQLPTTTVTTTPFDFIQPQVARFLASHEDIAYGMLPATSREARLWEIDRHWLRWVTGALLTLTAWPILVLVLRPGWGEWLQSHPLVAAAIVGLIWWLCFAPSIVGFAILMLVAWQALVTVRLPRVQLYATR